MAWEPPESDIDVGAEPIDRVSGALSVFTYVDKDNPANASGILHSVKVWADTNITGLRVGTFYVVSGNTLRCRDSVLIGDVEAGAERTFTGLSINVQEGDYIGCYFASGYIETDLSGYAGIWYASGEYIDPDDETTYTFSEGWAISLYGYGDIAPPDIDIGSEAIDRASYVAIGYTIIDKNNPANASGTLHTVKVYAALSLSGLRVGTFYTTNGNKLKCRDSALIGYVENGAARTFTGLSIAVEEGDYIGCYYTSGNIERDTEGFLGIWGRYGESIDLGDEATYTFYAGDAISLYGYGDIEVVVVEGTGAGSGVGLATSTGKLDVLASAFGNGIGLSLASPYLIIPASASGSGLGTSTIESLLHVLASASGSGIGEATIQALLEVLAQAKGSGAGQATTQAILDILAEAIGSGVGLGSTEALIRVLAAAAASGEGLGTAEALLEVIAEAAGSGIGEATAQAFRIVVLTYEEFAALEARIAALELALEPKAHFRI